jgi:hypothetical protein
MNHKQGEQISCAILLISTGFRRDVSEASILLEYDVASLITVPPAFREKVIVLKFTQWRDILSQKNGYQKVSSSRTQPESYFFRE